jgi:hypothetical protein
MNILVVTAPRCGSGYLTGLVEKLTGRTAEKWTPAIPFIPSKDEVESLKVGDRLIQTQGLSSRTAMSLLPEIQLVSCWRPLHDSLVSMLLSMRYRHSKLGSLPSPEMMSLLSSIVDVDDEVYVNTVVETQFGLIKHFIDSWKENNRLVLGENVSGFNYNILVQQQPKTIVRQLIDQLGLDVTPEGYQAALDFKLDRSNTTYRQPGAGKMFSQRNVVKINKYLKQWT